MKRLAFFLLAVLAGCASQNPDRTMPARMITAPDSEASQSELIPVIQVLRPQDVLDVIFYIALESTQPYKVQSGDQLDFVFMTPPVPSGIRTVMPDGTITLPYAASVPVAGRTLQEVEDALKARFEPTLKNQVFTVSVAKAQSSAQNLRDTLFNPSTGMSREVTVGKDGSAAFPMVGKLQLSGMSVEQLQEKLNQLYAEKGGLVKVDVLLKATAANQVYVMGEVAQPGAYPVQRPVSVLEALTLARGHNPVTADLDSVLVLHRQGDQVLATTYDVNALLKSNSAEVAYLQPDDLLFVPRSGLVKAGDTARKLADVVLFSGFNFGFSYRVDDKDED
ncbi:polysaccharide biosynthesis/export family protein [Pseudomonas resinovorans]|uniref:polysaccharide biosynthesis/export family protein n=1 Tax=Metapseudomonas resinovorans TaxID=53412 RepID=UPI00237F5A25|nr:polysaccharide biosynthesis/export family protein [Pseudomonas resinovorans]MDE3739157.1 polysaccharide biosynthesis/export family protein [Pseudomonas resinovorans]